jgi:hypothetical protein
MATNTDRGTLFGKSVTRIDHVWTEYADEPTDPRIKTLVQLMRDGASEEIQRLAEAELSNRGYFDGRMTRSRLIQGELFSEEEIR